MENTFFGKNNIHQAIWALVIACVVGVASFFVGRLSGPEKVIISTQPEDSVPLIVRVAPDENSSNANTSLKAIASHLEAIRDIQLGQKSLDEMTTTSKKTSKAAFNLPQVPSFKMPENVKGYTRASLVGFGEATCPDSTINQETVLLLQVYIEPKVRLESLTPAVIQMDKPNSRGGLTHVFRQQFELSNGINIFRLPLTLPVGQYHLEAGFYLRSDLKEEFPEYHSVRCPIEVES